MTSIFFPTRPHTGQKTSMEDRGQTKQESEQEKYFTHPHPVPPPEREGNHYPPPREGKGNHQLLTLQEGRKKGKDKLFVTSTPLDSWN